MVFLHVDLSAVMILSRLETASYRAVGDRILPAAFEETK